MISEYGFEVLAGTNFHDHVVTAKIRMAANRITP